MANITNTSQMSLVNIHAQTMTVSALWWLVSVGREVSFLLWSIIRILVELIMLYYILMNVRYFELNTQGAGFNFFCHNKDNVIKVFRVTERASAL